MQREERFFSVKMNCKNEAFIENFRRKIVEEIKGVFMKNKYYFYVTTITK